MLKEKTATILPPKVCIRSPLIFGGWYKDTEAMKGSAREEANTDMNRSFRGLDSEVHARCPLTFGGWHRDTEECDETV